MFNKIKADTEIAPIPGPLFGASLEELTTLMKGLNQPGYRAKQLHDALYRQRIDSLDQVTTFPAPLRDLLQAEGYTLGLPEIVQSAKSIDGTERYLIRMADGETVETVWMPDGDGGERGDGSPAAEEEEKRTPWPPPPILRSSRIAVPRSASPARLAVPSTASSASRPNSASAATSLRARSPARSPPS